MLVVLSPYHLTSREAAASATLLLAEHAVTMLPGGAGGRSHAAHHTRYAEFIESWRWSVPLWEAGVIASAFEDDDPRSDVELAEADIRSLPEFEGLRRVVALPDEGMTLDAVARDLLRAGPDPAISLPVAAGLDRFAARNDLIAVRAEARSLAQKAEERLADTTFRVGVPVLLQATAERLLEAREALADELRVLREAVEACFAGVASEDDVRDAGEMYARAFREHDDELTRVDDPDDARVVASSVALTGAFLPEDGVLAACAQTAEALRTRAAARSRPVAPVAQSEAGVATLTVRVMGKGGGNGRGTGRRTR